MASARGQRLAAMQNIAWAQDNQARTTGQLEGYTDKGLAALGQGVQGAKDVYNEYLPKTLAALGKGYDTGVGTINSGYDRAANDYRAGIAGLDPYAQRGNTAGDMLGNALGLNGAAGNTAATNAFQAGPGYGWQVDQATEAAARKANSLGIGASGNTLDALTRLGSNLANQEYSGWLDRLNGLNTSGQQAATSQLGAYQGLGNLGMQQGQNLATLAQNYGQNQASAYNDVGKSLAGAEMTQGTGAAGLYQGLGNSIANVNANTLNAMVQSNMAQAAASDAARNANENLALGLGGIGTKLLGLGSNTLGGTLFAPLGFK